MAAGAETSPVTPLGPPATRGRLVVRDRVVEQVARRAAGEVDAVTAGRVGAWESLAGAVSGHAGTRVDVTRAGDRVGLTVHLAVAWPEPLAGAAADARSAVSTAVSRYAGLTVERTDVLVDTAPSRTTTDTDATRNAGAGEADRGLSTAPAARPPVGAPASALPSVLVSLVLVGVGVVGVRDALVTTGAIAGTPWMRTTADAVSGAVPTVAVLLAGVVGVLVGLWFVSTALRPRPRRGLAVDAASDVWVAPRDAARLTTAAVARVGGVTGTRVRASRSVVAVTVTGQTGESDLSTPARDAAAAGLAGLTQPPRIRLRNKAVRSSTPTSTSTSGASS